MDMARIGGEFERRMAERGGKLKDFFDPQGTTRHLVVQRPAGKIWGACNSVTQSVANNLAQLEEYLAVDWTDELPYLEAWIGTGVYANAFGCEYVFREAAAPHVHYKYHKIEEVKGIDYPDWRKSPVMNMVLECADALKDTTGGRIPLALTDTQSAFDTATLILDAAEFFTACYSDEEIVMEFMEKINNLIIEFSREQAMRIGDALVAKPGHIMASAPFLKGISVSDDNLAVSSPHINELISLPFNRKLAEEFGGLAIHSCGVWSHTMSALAKIPGVFMIDCAVDKSRDPNPNEPAKVRDALKGTGVIAQIRPGSDMTRVGQVLEEIYDPELKLIVNIGYSTKEEEEKNYRFVNDKLDSLSR